MICPLADLCAPCVLSRLAPTPAPGEKPHKCELCDFMCRDVSYLSKHMLTHSDAKDYMCAECGYVTKWKHYLSVHMRKHSGDLRFERTHPRPESRGLSEPPLTQLRPMLSRPLRARPLSPAACGCLCACGQSAWRETSGLGEGSIGPDTGLDTQVSPEFSETGPGKQTALWPQT